MEYVFYVYLTGFALSFFVTLLFWSYLDKKYRLYEKLEKRELFEIIVFSSMSWLALLHVLEEWAEEVENENNL